MAIRSRRMHNCRIYHAIQLQAFDPNQPFSTTGGYADLYRASHVEDGDLALKRLRWGTGDLNDRFAQATEEAGLWQVLHHPNVLAFLGILYSNSHIYLVSPFAPHGSLPHYLAAHPDADRTIFISHIAAGLAYLHSKNVIHGDVKGANILVSRQLTAQLCDFGLSKFANTAASNGTTGSSLPWLSPERMNKVNAPRTRESDVYAFGMSIYEILSGFIPFHTLSANDLIIAVCIRDERPKFSTAGTSYTPLWLLAGNCWDKDPAKRLPMKQVRDRISSGDATTVANRSLEDTPGPQASSHAMTFGRKRKRGFSDASDTTSMDNPLQKDGGVVLQTTQPTQNEGSKRAVKRLKVSELSETTDDGCSSVDESSQEDADTWLTQSEGSKRAVKRLTVSEPYETTDDGRSSVDESSQEGADTWLTRAVSDVKVALNVLSNHISITRSNGESIVNIMAARGLAIIKILENMEMNWEQGMELGRHIGTLIQCAARFLENPVSGLTESCNPQTSTQLQFFLYSLKALEKTLAHFHQHGWPRHHNEDNLMRWEARISRTFAALQNELSLHSLRLVTKLNDTGTRLERDRLLGLLGDGDIGATEKASSAADLMCLPGTRTVVLDQVDQWIADPSGSRIFWISGVAGCGKSALAATIAGRPRAIPTSIATFYFVRGNQERNKRVLCSLSRQLAQFGHGSLEHFVLSAVKTKPDIATSHIDTQFQHLVVDPLKRLVRGSSPVILVIDALDEWNNYDAVLKMVELIGKAHTELPPTLRFVLASRNEPHLLEALGSHSMRPLVTRCPPDAILKSDTGRDIQRYIEERFAKLCARSGIDTHTWPNPSDVESLVMLSDGLFQWAATVMSYIGARRSQARLREILQNPERYRALDSLYKGVLETSLREQMNERVPRLLQFVLGAILTAPVPINAIAIAYLCCEDIEMLKETTELIQGEVLPSLASMFLIPEDPIQPITVSHKSVLDYLTTKDRCTDDRFYIDPVLHHARVFDACVRLMKRDLKRDICGTDDPSKLNTEIQDQVESHVPLGLQYLCLHWAAYLPGFDHNASIKPRRRLEEFSREHLLHWLEVLSLSGLTEAAIPIARNVEHWLSAHPSLSPTDELTRRLWSDTQRFVAMFLYPISTAAAHIYTSALRLAPTDTHIVQQFTTNTGQGIRILGGLLGKKWPPSTWTAHGHTRAVHCVSFSPDGKTILSGSRDKSLRIWYAESGAQKCATLEGHTEGAWCPSFSPDGETILSGSNDETPRPWDVGSDAQRGAVLQGHTRPVYCTSSSPDGKTILSGSSDTTLRLWDAESGAQKGEALEGHTDVVWCASFSPDGKTILSGSFDNTLRLWDATSGAQKGRILEGHTDAVYCASFSPDGKTILSGSIDTTLRLWDTESGTQKGNALKGHKNEVTCASFSPDGRTILSGSNDKTLRLWDSDVGALRVEPRNGHSRGVSCFLFSPDGGTVISGSYDKTVRFWDAETGAPEAEPLSASGTVTELSFSADGLKLRGKTYNGSSHEWNVEKHISARSATTRSQQTTWQSPREPVFEGSVSSEGWIFHRNIRWFWVPFPYADWLLCGTRLALRHERVIYIINVSEIMYIVE